MFDNYPNEILSMLVNSVPKYVKVENDLMNRIKSGELVIGAKVPTEMELCEAYSCSRQTIRKALDDLYRDGYIYRVQGLGTFVKDRQPQKQDFHDIVSCSSLIKSQNKLPSKKILFSGADDCPDNGAKKFNIENGSRVFKYVRIYYADGIPVIYCCSYFNLIEVPGLEAIDFSNRSIVEVLKSQYGIEMRCTERELKAVAADKKMAEYLDVPENFPLLRVSDLKAVFKGSEKIPIEYYIFDYVTDRIKYFPDL